MSFAILGMGTALPPDRVTQDEAAEVAKITCCQSAEQAGLMPVLYRQTGVEARHLVHRREVVTDILNGTATSGSIYLPSGQADDRGPTTSQRMQHYAEEAPALALQATSRALTQAELLPRSISHLITVSCTGFQAPGVDIRLIKGLDLSPTVQRTHVGFMGCHGALNGLRVARAFTGADASACVLLCAIELCSLHFHYGWNPKKIVGNALFADGAAAVVGGAAAAAPLDAWRAVAAGSCLIPDSEYAMNWGIGDHGFEMGLSARVPNLISTHLRAWLESWLNQNDVTLADIASWAVHPGGPRILSAVEKPLGLTPEAMAVSREVLSSHGNMSSPTVLFILDRLRSRQAPRPCVALGFGPGLVAEAVLFT